MRNIYKRRMEEATRNLTAWCPDHVVRFDSGTLGGEPMELLTWHKPGTGIHFMRFLSMGPRLIVTGDLYEAVYCREHGVRWWSRLGLQYFAEKCQASAQGRIPTEWDGDECLHSAKEHIRERMRYAQSDGREFRLWRRFKDLDGPDAAENEHDWTEFCRAYGDEFFGQDWWEIRFGRVISLDIAYHLAGLKLAVAALEAQQSPALVGAALSGGDHA